MFLALLGEFGPARGARLGLLANRGLHRRPVLFLRGGQFEPGLQTGDLGVDQRRAVFIRELPLGAGLRLWRLGIGTGRQNRQQKRCGGGGDQKMFFHRICFLVVAGETPDASSASRARRSYRRKFPVRRGGEGAASIFGLLPRLQQSRRRMFPRYVLANAKCCWIASE
jgi:hypothetical protein